MILYPPVDNVHISVSFSYICKLNIFLIEFDKDEFGSNKSVCERGICFV